VVTLNPSELAHVLGVDAHEVEDDPEGAVDRLVTVSGAVVLLGGETKYVGGPDAPIFAVAAGCPGLATSGSGDVQAGLVTGLLARGAEPVQAAVWAAWLHGTAGERLATSIGALGFLAGELAAEVPGLLDEVSGAATRPRG
jgi:ADP-dependent NAD(P)H-hydrate dehydratase